MILFLCEHFGTGELTTTTFAYLLPTALTSLTDPCLPDAFSRHDKETAEVVTVVSALYIHRRFGGSLTTRGVERSRDATKCCGADDYGNGGEGGLLPDVAERSLCSCEARAWAQTS